MFKMGIILFLSGVILSSLVSGNERIHGAQDIIPYEHLYTNEAFYFSINNRVFNNSEMVESELYTIKFRPSIISMPDLPKWMRYFYSDYYHDGFLYGAPTKPEDLTIEVVATNMDNFETVRKLIRLIVKNRESRDKTKGTKEKNETYQVEIKFTNLNVDDMFVDDRLDRLTEIFSRRLWRNGKNVHVALVDSAVDLGGRRPPNPKEKDGVIVRIGSSDDFSRELKNLEREVMTIRNRGPCPKDYKKTSAERFFRDEDLIPDWCGFKLLYPHHHYSENSPIWSPIHLTSDDFRPPDRILPVNEQRLTDFLMCLILPTTFALILAGILSWIMFGRREGVEKRNMKTPNIQMVQYASIHRASANLRGMTSNRNGPTSVATTPNSTLHRSPANSPSNTLGK